MQIISKIYPKIIYFNPTAPFIPPAYRYPTLTPLTSCNSSLFKFTSNFSKVSKRVSQYDNRLTRVNLYAKRLTYLKWLFNIHYWTA